MKIKTIVNTNGKTIKYVNSNIINKDNLYFKDLVGDGVLYPFEDHRLSNEERAKDLANRLSIKQALGLMLHSSHQSVPAKSDSYYGKVTYDGIELNENTPVGMVSDQQKDWIINGHLRHILITSIKSNEHMALWVNNLQALAEQQPFGIPVNISSDPRHGTTVTFEYDAGAGGDISHWPEPIGMAATFDKDKIKEFGKIAAKEYRALGIATTLGPQADIASEPRWSRISGTFGESEEMVRDMAKAYIDGYQGDEWNETSVMAMIKHFPGAGPALKGRNSHYPSGKISTYPTNSLQRHIDAFDLKQNNCVAVMPSYAITENYGEKVGAAFSNDVINGLLRNKLGFNGVICTDWSLLKDEAEPYSFMGGRCWGVEELSEVERLAKIIIAGNDQLGGIVDYRLLNEAYELLIKRFDKSKIDKLIKDSAERILLNTFRLGLFENPYINDDYKTIVGNPEFMEKGYQAQLSSIIMLKNHNSALPLNKDSKVYIPGIEIKESTDWIGNKSSDHQIVPPFDKKFAGKYFNLCSLEESDYCLALVRMPGGESDAYDGYSMARGYIPISLQYHHYQSKEKRDYDDINAYSINESDINTLIQIKKDYPDKKIITLCQMTGPIIMSEFEPYCDGIVAMSGELYQAALQIITGKHEPSALLPYDIPKDMDEVENNKEDESFDMECHTDDDGNTYEFGFGLNFKGKIKDNRTSKYQRKRGF